MTARTGLPAKNGIRQYSAVTIAPSPEASQRAMPTDRRSADGITRLEPSARVNRPRHAHRRHHAQHRHRRHGRCVIRTPDDIKEIAPPRAAGVVNRRVHRAFGFSVNTPRTSILRITELSPFASSPLDIKLRDIAKLIEMIRELVMACQAASDDGAQPLESTRGILRRAARRHLSRHSARRPACASTTADRAAP